MRQQESISAALESEHRCIDERFKRFEEGLASGHVVAEPFEEAAKVLHRHIYIEEEVLFPAVEARGLVGPTAVMAMEHGEICRFLGGIRDLIQEKASPGRIQGSFKALRSLLEEHNFKEERVLYPNADRILGQDDVRAVVEDERGGGPRGLGVPCPSLRQGMTRACQGEWA